MSDVAQPEPEPIRIGHAERQAAVEALKHHHEAGRIDSQEYEERSVKATNARSRAELDTLFTDLPHPHAVAGETLTTLTPGAPPAEPPAPAAEPARRGVLNIPEPLATTIVSATPILAVILFFLTDSWLWFLAIPLVATVIYGSESHPERDRKRRRRS